MSYFDFENLDVYQVSMNFVLLANEIMKNFPRGTSNLSDQLNRASTSVLFNIAEGAGEFAEIEKIRFYRMARRSATECAAILQLSNNLKLLDNANYFKSRELLIRIISMLSRMTRKYNAVTHTGAVTVTEMGGKLP
ncbi:MAG: four helix bundle protein [Simkaniaceae bacterium]|nr:four helix bundle protein [Simkaniaceae bacterium]